MNKTLKGFVYSSVDSQKISLTLKSLLPLIILLLPIFGIVNIGENDLVELINAIAVAITGALTLYGAIRKIKIKVFGVSKEPKQDDKV